MDSTPRTVVRFLSSLLLAVGLGGGVVLGGAWLLPRVFASFGTDVSNLPRWLLIQSRGPGEARRLDQAIRDIEDARQVKDAIARSVVDGSLTEAEGLAVFRDLVELDADLRERLHLSMPGVGAAGSAVASTAPKMRSSSPWSCTPMPGMCG